MRYIKLPFSLLEYDNLQDSPNIPQNIKVWLKKASVLEKQLKDRHNTVDQCHSLIEKSKQLWRDDSLIQWMLSLSHDKCWYTEAKHCADYPEIEHFRPKKRAWDEYGTEVHQGYYWLAFNLANYRLCKPMPNRKKGTYFPLTDERRRARSPNDCHLDELPLFSRSGITDGLNKTHV